jgi:long-subunit fatty acid transport protein
MYADKGIKDSGNESFSPVSYDINPVLDELGVGLGAAYSINENINIAITYSYTWFMEGEDPMTGDEKLNKDRHIIGIQVGYKM